MTTAKRRIGVNFHLTYKRKLLLYSLLLSMVPVILIGLLSSWTTASVIQEEADQSQQTILKQLAAQVDDLLMDLENTSVRLANDQTIKKSLEAGISQNNIQITMDMMDLIMNATANANVQFDISLFYARYSQIYSSANGIIREVEHPFTDIVRRAKQLYFGSVVIAPGTFPEMKEMLLLRAVPLNSTDPLGYLIMHLNTGEMKRFLDRMEMGRGRKVLIVDDQGVILTSQGQVEPGTKLAPPEVLYPFWNNATGSEDVITIDKIDYQVSTLRSTVKNWTFIAMTPVSELEAASNKLMTITWSIVGGLLLLCIGTSMVGFRRIYSPIQILASKFGIPPMGEDELQLIDASMVKLAARNTQLQTQLNEQLPYFKESLFLQLLRGEMTPREIHKIMMDYDFPGNEGWFYAMVVEIEKSAYVNKAYKEEDRFLIMYGLRNIIEELFHPSFRAYATVMPKSGQVVVLISVDKLEGEGLNKIASVGEEIRVCANTYLNLTIQVALSSPRKSYASIAESYEEALRLMDYRWVLGNRSSISADSLQQSDKQSIRKLAKHKMAIMDGLSHNDFVKAKEELNGMIAQIPSSLHQAEAILGVISILIGEIEQFVKERGFDLNDLFEYNVLEYLFDLSSLEEVRAWISDEVFQKVAECLDQQHASHQKKMIPQVLHYIHSHFDSDLSLQKLAGLFHVSTTTMSRVFKEETDSTYLDYIIRYRMEKAKEWLTSTDMPIKEIAERLHYTTVQNFTRIFKQVTGATPGSYRKQEQRGEFSGGGDRQE